MSGWITRVLMRLACVVLPLPVVAADTPVLPTPALITALRRVDDPQISPDGRWIAYTVATSQAMAPAHTQIWRVSATGKRNTAPLAGNGEDDHPRWSADGRQLAFLSRRPLPESAEKELAGRQVWQVDSQSNTAVLLSRSRSDVSAFALSHDSRQLAYLATDPATRVAKAEANVVGGDAVERAKPLSRVWVRDLPDGATRALTDTALQVHDLAWSPDGRTLALRVSRGATLNDYWYRSRIVIIDAATGASLKELELRASAFPVQWSPDGKRLLYGRLGASGMTAAPIVHDLASGEQRRLGEDWPGTLWLVRWQDDRTLIGQGRQGVRGAFLAIDATTGRWREVAHPQIQYQAFTTTRGGRSAYLGLRDDQPAEVWMLERGRLNPRTDTNPQVATWAHGTVREIEWTSPHDGRRLFGVLVTPPDWPGKKPLPTLVQIHGGPAWAWWSGWLGSWHDWAQLLATRGYAVFLPNPRGSEGQGDAFTELARQDWGGGDFHDILAGIDQLEKDGVIDSERLAIGGWSYGGYMAAWAASHSTRFKTAVVGAGVTDIGAMALTTDTPDYLPGYFGNPVANRATYDAHSPIRFAGEIGIPVLVLHGEADRRVPFAQGQMLYGALTLGGTPVELVSYPNGPHWLVDPRHEQDVQERVLAWLSQYLR